MPRKRKYDSFFDYKHDGSALCLLGGCSRPVLSRSQSNGMPKHLRVHHPDQYAQMMAASELKISATSNDLEAKADGEAVEIIAAEAAVSEQRADQVAISVCSVEYVIEADKQCKSADTDSTSDFMAQGDGEAVDSAPGAAAADDEEDAAVTDSDDEEEYEVEAILEKRVTVELKTP